jgi:predicted PurR-regulated permease PerM
MKKLRSSGSIWPSVWKVSGAKHQNRNQRAATRLAKQMIRYVLLAVAVCLLFVFAYFSAGWFLDAEQPQQELKLDVGPQNVDQRP